MARAAYRIERGGSGGAEACRALLEDLPEWFGVPEAVDAYVADAAATEPLFAFARERDPAQEASRVPIGLLVLTRQAARSWEIHLLAVGRAHHRRGVGSALVAAAADASRQEGGRYLTVKTLSAASADPNYAKTREFYRAVGFEPLMEAPTLWGASNPCLIMIRQLCDAPP